MEENKNYKVDFSEEKSIIVESSHLQGVSVLHETKTSMVLQFENKIYNIEFENFNPKDKAYQISINHKKISLQLNDKLDQLVNEMGLNLDSDDIVSNLEAPMPGLVLDILVTEGQEVEKGTPLLVLEAMKMENIIKATGQGVVEKILITKGDKVEKSQLLINYEIS